MAFSVGLGLTNECNLRCPHCYRPDMVVQRLTLRDVQQVCESIPARSVNLGVGENGLHTEYVAILDYLRAQVALRSDLLGVYLETATEANVAYYSHVGYRVIGEIYPLGVRMWRMLQSCAA